MISIKTTARILTILVLMPGISAGGLPAKQEVLKRFAALAGGPEAQVTNAPQGYFGFSVDHLSWDEKGPSLEAFLALATADGRLRMIQGDRVVNRPGGPGFQGGGSPPVLVVEPGLRPGSGNLLPRVAGARKSPVARPVEGVACSPGFARGYLRPVLRRGIRPADPCGVSRGVDGLAGERWYSPSADLEDQPQGWAHRLPDRRGIFRFLTS